MSFLSLLFKHLKHAFFHAVHGTFPSLLYFERKVETTDFDHVNSDTKKTSPKEFWSHWKFNLQCMVRHFILGIFQFIDEVEFK
jgi:hypothetical protein